MYVSTSHREKNGQIKRASKLPTIHQRHSQERPQIGEVGYPRSTSRRWPVHVKQERFNISHVHVKLPSFFRPVIRDFFPLDLCTLVSAPHLGEKPLTQPFVILLLLDLVVRVQHHVHSIISSFLIGRNPFNQLLSRLDSPPNMERQGEDRGHRRRIDNLIFVPLEVINAPSMICLEFQIRPHLQRKLQMILNQLPKARNQTTQESIMTKMATMMTRIAVLKEPNSRMMHPSNLKISTRILPDLVLDAKMSRLICMAVPFAAAQRIFSVAAAQLVKKKAMAKK